MWSRGLGWQARVEAAPAKGTVLIIWQSGALAGREARVDTASVTTRKPATFPSD